MPPSPRDKATATALADRIVRVARDRVHGIFMIGSRALGHATSSSDLDLVVLIETEAGERPWGGSDAAAEACRIQREVGAPPLRSLESPDTFRNAGRAVAVIIPTAEDEHQVHLLSPVVGAGGQYHRIRAAQKAVTALCVAHQIDTSKRDGFDTVFARLRKAEPDFTAEWGSRMINGKFTPMTVGQIVAAALHTAFSREGAHPCVTDLRRRLQALDVTVG